MKRMIACCLLFALLMPLVAPLAASAQDIPDGVPSGSEAVTVASVPNGGTLFITREDGSQRAVGLIGVSAPLFPTDQEAGQCFGAEAQAWLERLAPVGSTVFLETDEGVRERDETLLRFVWSVPEGADKPVLINLKMLRDGRADLGQSGDTSKYADELADAQERAEDDGKGAWGACGEMHKNNPPTVAQIKAGYGQPADLRDLFIRPGSLLGQKIVLSGTVRTIVVAQPGYGYGIGDLEPIFVQSVLQIDVPLATGGSEYVVIGYDGDPQGIYEETWVTVWGMIMGTHTITNAFGGQVTQPFVVAEIIEAG